MSPADRALLVDYGGVLTTGLRASFASFEAEHGLAPGAITDVLVAAYRTGAGESMVTRVERGELSDEEFERALSAAFAQRGHDVPAAGLRARLFRGMRPGGGMWDVVRRARDAGVTTCLLSNSWGSDGYPLDRLRAVFDHLVFSGEVGMRKPDAEIFRHAAALVGRAPEACAFVDDLRANVAAARALGMHGVHHTDAATTAAELGPFLGVRLTGSDPTGRSARDPDPGAATR